MKTASITLLTGHSGAGKSTMARNIRHRYDVDFVTDLGHAGRGRYVMPSLEKRRRLRDERLKKALAAHYAGRRVLFEGSPQGLLKYREVIPLAEKIIILDVPADVRRQRVIQRAGERGTSVAADLRAWEAHEPQSAARLEEILRLARTKDIEFVKNAAAGDYERARAWARLNVKHPRRNCFFYSAVLSLLFGLRLMKGPPLPGPGETAHFWVEDDRGRVIDPTARPTGPGTEVSAVKNIDHVIGHRLFKTLPPGDQARIRSMR
jgi:hypothetical protein